MKNFVVSAALAFGLATSAAALPITVSGVGITTDSGGPDGLAVETDTLISTPYFVADLAVGQSAQFDLFDIWTNQATSDGSDGTIEVEIALAGLGSGSTMGLTFEDAASGSNQGVLDFSDSETFSIFYGTGVPGRIDVTLNGGTFNFTPCGVGQVFCDLEPGRDGAYSVTATIAHVYDPSPVPAPGALALLGLGLAGLGLRRRRAA